MSKFNTSFEYFDPNRINDKYTFTTTIWLASDGCSISGYSNLDKEFVYLQFLADFKVNIYSPLIPRIKELLALPNIAILLNQSSHVKIVIDEHRFSLIPSALLDENHLESTFKLTNNLGVHEELNLSEIEAFNHHIVYPVNDILSSFIKENFESSVEISTISKELISSLSHLNSDRDQILVHFKADTIFILVKKNNQLIFTNSFKFTNHDDAIYFIVYSLEKLGLEAKSTSIFVSGQTDKSSPLIKAIESYVESISILDISLSKNLFFKLKLAEVHMFPQLFNIA